MTLVLKVFARVCLYVSLCTVLQTETINRGLGLVNISGNNFTVPCGACLKNGFGKRLAKTVV